MPTFIHQILDLVEARPLTSLIVLIAAVLYIRLMTSNPRAY
ncbi:MAG: hypothetical protein U1C74_12900 [Phenylobacterium sp.]|nr:hypothetical protein [Phenylobacterium sp.]